MTKRKENPKRGGRPTDYRPEYCQAIIAHLADGYDIRCFAASIGVHEDTIYEWAKVHPAFSEAKKYAKDLSYKWWVEKGMHGMHDTVTVGEDGKPRVERINATMYVWMTKNMIGWRDKHDLEARVTDPTDKTVEGLLERLAELEADKE